MEVFREQALGLGRHARGKVAIKIFNILHLFRGYYDSSWSLSPGILHHIELKHSFIGSELTLVREESEIISQALVTAEPGGVYSGCRWVGAANNVVGEVVGSYDRKHVLLVALRSTLIALIDDHLRYIQL